MPNAVITIYIADDDYVFYSKHKKEINEEVREQFKKIMGAKK